MSNLSKFISEIIKEYIEGVDLSEINDSSDFESDDLSDIIEQGMLKRSLKFNPLVSLSVGCKTCNRPFGNWVSDNGHEVSPSFLEQNQRKIIILDDF